MMPIFSFWPSAALAMVGAIGKTLTAAATPIILIISLRLKSELPCIRMWISKGGSRHELLNIPLSFYASYLLARTALGERNEPPRTTQTDGAFDASRYI